MVMLASWGSLHRMTALIKAMCQKSLISKISIDRRTTVTLTIEPMTMACTLALYEFVNEDNALEIGDSSRIVGFRKDLFNNEAWDIDTVCEVRWPGKKGTFENVAARVLRFGDNRSELKGVLDRLLGGEDIQNVNQSLGFLGRGKRSKRPPQRLSISSDDENLPIPSKQNKKIKTASANRAGQDILSVLKERNQLKQTNSSSTDMEHLQKEVANLKQAVCDLKETTRSLLELNASLVSTVASLTGHSETVEKVRNLVSSIEHSQPTSTRPIPPQPEFPTLSTSQVPEIDVMPVEPEPVEGSVREDQDTPEDLEFSVPSRLVNRACKTDARKMTNDLLHGLYSEEYLASHSVTGGKRAGGLASKPSMDPAQVAEITKTVQIYFKEKTVADIHYYMREKLNNVSKNMKRKQAKI